MASTGHLVLSLPQGNVVATSLGIEDFAKHASPGTLGGIKDRKVLFDLASRDGAPAFRFLDEGGWRDANRDATDALAALTSGKRTKTALSNSAFSCTPIDAMQRSFLVKTGGQLLEMQQRVDLARFATHAANERMKPDDVAAASGQPPVAVRPPRQFLVLAPSEFLVLSNLSPAEYAWYSTHRPGKMFRQVSFVELEHEHHQLADRELYDRAHEELEKNPAKKTKTIVQHNCMNYLLFRDWRGYAVPSTGGLYVADREHCAVWRFPEVVPRAWERAEG